MQTVPIEVPVMEQGNDVNVAVIEGKVHDEKKMQEVGENTCLVEEIAPETTETVDNLERGQAIRENVCLAEETLAETEEDKTEEQICKQAVSEETNWQQVSPGKIGRHTENIEANTSGDFSPSRYAILESLEEAKEGMEMEEGELIDEDVVPLRQQSTQVKKGKPVGKPVIIEESKTRPLRAKKQTVTKENPPNAGGKRGKKN